MPHELREGLPAPIRATWDGKGVNFALFSEHATKVELCLFDSVDSTKPSRTIPLPDRTDLVFHGYFPDVEPGQLYGYRVHGPFDPVAGHRFNPAKILLDPYAKAIGRDAKWDNSLFGYQAGKDDLSINETLTRTIITGATALLALSGLAIFGGSALRDFSIVLMFGIAIGTYSSIYIASPIVLLWGVKRGEEAEVITPQGARP